MMSVYMNYESIKNATETSKAIHSFLASRQRNRKSLNLRLLAYNMEKNGIKYVHTSFVDYFKSLVAANAGKLIFDKDGNVAYFVCNQPILTTIGVEKAPEVRAPRKESKSNVVPMRKRNKQVARPIRRVGRPSNAKTVLVGLRKGVDFQLQLPQDFNKDDAKMVYVLLKKAAKAG